MSKRSLARLEYLCLCSASVLALATGAAAQTTVAQNQNQNQNQSAGQVEEVEVTATRVSRQGYMAPTKVQTLNSDDILKVGRTSIADVLSDTPMAIAAQSQLTQVGNVQGFSAINLYDLGMTRTLVLVDGQRPVFIGANVTIVFDPGTIPTGLISKMDIVTGGASAEWGSEAVAGVVNIVMNDKLDGISAGAQLGDTQHYGGASSQFDFSYGGFFGNQDRGHIMFGVQYDDQDKAGPRDKNPTLQYGFIANPAFTATNGQPNDILVKNPFSSVASLGGLITAAPAGGANLVGTAFGPGGTPYAFQYGTYKGSVSMSGGDPEAGNSGLWESILVPSRALDFYGKTTWDVLDNLKLNADLRYSDSVHSEDLFPDSTPNSSPITIANTNAFLPASVAAQMAADHVTSFTLGRFNSDYNMIHNTIASHTMQGSIGADGTFTLANTKWSWDAFASYGQDRTSELLGPQKITDLFLQSVDSIISPTTGKPICRIALTYPSTACVPVNLFGVGSVTPAALAYWQAPALFNSLIAQDEGAVTFRGDPFSTWAGPVSIAFGGEWRRESVNQNPDQLSANNRLDVDNFQFIGGAYSVGEGFIEGVVPLLSNVMLAKEFDFEGAIRESFYSTSTGQITSWKLGLSDEVTEGVKLRAALSQDVRAPSLAELYLQRATSFGSIVDPRNNSQPTVDTYTGGNTALAAEISHTVTYGANFQPTWLPGFTGDINYWLTDIHGAITNLSAQNIVNGCFLQGIASLCSDIVQSGGVITAVYSNKTNVQKIEASGIDLDMAYLYDLNNVASVLDGQLRSHMIAEYFDKYRSVTNVLQDTVALGVLRYKATFDETYILDDFNANVRLRYNGPAQVANQTTSYNYPHVAAQGYIDLRLGYNLHMGGSDWQVYGNIINVMDRIAPYNGSSVYDDYLGRVFNVGVRINM